MAAKDSLLKFEWYTGMARVRDETSATDTSGNTFQCRAYSLALSAAGATPYAVGCSASSVTGATFCVNPPPTCAVTCARIMQACTGLNVQYGGSSTACLAACASWPAGLLADIAGDTVGCRAYHAGVANGSTTAAGNHCPHTAQFSGGGTCGTNCEAFCDTAIYACTGANVIYANKTACVAACASFPTSGSSGDTGGNTLFCRQYHINVANEGDATLKQTHCPHAAAVPTAQCIVPSTASSTATAYSSSSSTAVTINAATSVAASSAPLLLALAAALVAAL